MAYLQVWAIWNASFGNDLGNGCIEYEIPASDYDGLDLTDNRIPFVLRNPKDANDEYWMGAIYLDNVFFE